MRKRILIAEDEEIARESLAGLAALHGYDVTTVSNGVDLLLVAVKEHFDFVITDLMMKDLDGVAAAKILKLQGDSTPVIAITGASCEDLQNEQEPFTRIFYKPVNIKELFEYVEKLHNEIHNPLDINGISPQI